MDLDLPALWPYADDFLSGLLRTAWLTVLTVALSFSLAALGLIARMSSFAPLRRAAQAYIHVVRNSPTLVLLYVVYFGLGQSGLSVSPFQAALAALTINTTAYVIEIYRGGLAGIDKGQYEAAASLSISGYPLWRFVLLPQALAKVFPVLGNIVVATVLSTSLVMVVSYGELTYVALNVGAETYRYFEAFIVAGVMYIAVAQIFGLSWDRLDRSLFGSEKAR